MNGVAFENAYYSKFSRHINSQRGTILTILNQLSNQFKVSVDNPGSRLCPKRKYEWEKEPPKMRDRMIHFISLIPKHGEDQEISIQKSDNFSENENNLPNSNVTDPINCEMKSKSLFTRASERNSMIKHSIIPPVGLYRPKYSEIEKHISTPLLKGRKFSFASNFLYKYEKSKNSSSTHKKCKVLKKFFVFHLNNSKINSAYSKIYHHIQSPNLKKQSSRTNKSISVNDSRFEMVSIPNQTTKKYNIFDSRKLSSDFDQKVTKSYYNPPQRFIGSKKFIFEKVPIFVNYKTNTSMPKKKRTEISQKSSARILKDEVKNVEKQLKKL